MSLSRWVGLECSDGALPSSCSLSRRPGEDRQSLSVSVGNDLELAGTSLCVLSSGSAFGWRTLFVPAWLCVERHCLALRCQPLSRQSDSGGRPLCLSCAYGMESGPTSLYRVRSGADRDGEPLHVSVWD